MKFAISIVWDILDFTIFRIPLLGEITDAIGAFLAMGLWGYGIGALAWWEELDWTEQIDAEVPTLTIIGVISWLWNMFR